MLRVIYPTPVPVNILGCSLWTRCVNRDVDVCREKKAKQP